MRYFSEARLIWEFRDVMDGADQRHLMSLPIAARLRNVTVEQILKAPAEEGKLPR